MLWLEGEGTRDEPGTQNPKWIKSGDVKGICITIGFHVVISMYYDVLCSNSVGVVPRVVTDPRLVILYIIL